MTITLRATKGSALTWDEMDTNFSELSVGTFISVTDYGATGDGTTDDTVAINLTITSASGRAVYFPAGTYKVTSTLTTIAGQLTIFGDGMFKSRIQFAPTAADTLFYLDNGAAKVTHVTMRDFACYSADTTYVKVAIDARDLSVCNFERIYIHGSGISSGPGSGAGWGDATNGSIGIRFQGREAVSVKGIEIIADKPLYFDANPNTSATDGEDCDHFHFSDIYLIGNGNPLVEVAAGLGAMEMTWDGYQAWVGGTNGFKINDTRVAPTIASRGIKFKNVRREQGTSAAAYVFDMTFTQPAQTIKLENCLNANGTNGISISGFERVVLDEITGAATSGTSLITANATASSVLVMRGCIWTTGGAVTLTGLTQIHAQAYRSASYAAPSDAVYAGQITDTLLNVGKVTATAANTTVGLLVTSSTTGDALQVLPQAAASGTTVRGVNNAGSDFTPLNFTYSQMNWAYRTGVATSSTGMIANSAGLQHSLRHQEKQGANVTAANNLTLGSDGNYFQVDGATQINLILNTNWQGGVEVTLKFNSTPTVKHNQAASGNNKPIILNGAVDFVAAASNTLTLRYDATDTAWYEQSRKV